MKKTLRRVITMITRAGATPTTSSHVLGVNPLYFLDFRSVSRPTLVQKGAITKVANKHRRRPSSIWTELERCRRRTRWPPIAMRQRPDMSRRLGGGAVSSCPHPANMDGRAATAPLEWATADQSPHNTNHHGNTPMAAKAVALLTRVASSVSLVNLAASANAATAAAPKQTRDSGPNHGSACRV